MRILIDTNILISAALSSAGTPYKAFVKAVSYPNHGLVRVFKAKNKIYTPENALKLCKYAAFFFRKNNPFTSVWL